VWTWWNPVDIVGHDNGKTSELLKSLLQQFQKVAVTLVWFNCVYVGRLNENWNHESFAQSLLHQQDRWRSIVMSTPICLCVCLSVHEDSSGTTCAMFTNFSVYVACGGGSVLLLQGQGDEFPRGRGSFGSFLPHWQCIVTHLLQKGSFSPQ